MSSGTRSQSDAYQRMSGAIDAKTFNDRVGHLGMSPRQMELNRRWSYYCCAQYDARMVDWDGTRREGMVETDVIAQKGFIPPGFYDAAGQMAELPLKYRRPTTPYHLCKVIVERFTGMLFSERRHPNLDVEGDEQTADWIGSVAEVTRLWPAMIKARGYGGAMGSVAVGFQFKQGKPVIEVHDPRWLFPTFVDRASLKLGEIEKRYMYPVEERDPDSGLWVPIWYWYRRVINETQDVLFKPALVADGDEPQWEEQEIATHGLGFCPVVWTQNLPVDDDVDGEPDCHGIWDMVAAIDALLAQAHKGTLANCDPTLAMENVGDMEIPSLKKGSGNAVKLPQGTAKYLEISGTGPASARELAKELRGLALEVAQVVLDHPDVAGRTATEVERVYSSMLAKADVLREQYGQRCVLPLMEMIRKAAVKLGQPTQDETGQIVRYALSLPPRYDGETEVATPRVLGKADSQLTIHWPGYFDPSLQDAQLAAQAASSAKAAGLIDDENAAKFISSYFRIDDVKASLERIAAQTTQAQQGFDSELLGRSMEAPVVDSPDAVDTGVKFFQYEIEGGIVTINEVRATKGLPPIPDGDLTLPEFRAKHMEVFAKSMVSQTSGSAEQFLGMHDDADGEKFPQ